jgi:hypothetical protein
MTPQVLITLSPDGSLIAELPGINGSRRQVPITSLSSIRTILSAQLSRSPTTIGTDGAPTSGQVRHWEQHTSIPDPQCPWCIAAEMGIDTSRAAHTRARRLLQSQRAQSSHPYHRVGDGSVKVRIIPKQSRHITATPARISWSDLFNDTEADEEAA